MPTIKDSICNDVEYIVLTPFEIILRRLGHIIVFLLWACTFYFVYTFIKNFIENGFTFETRIYIIYGLLCIFIAGITNMIRPWLSSRRLELAEDMDLDFQYKWVQKDYHPQVMQRSVPNYDSQFSVHDNDREINNSSTKNSNYEFKEKQGFENSNEMLENLIGLKSVKEEVLKLKLRLELEKKQELQGRTSKSKYNMHMVFTGNPGTGKTTVARIITGILYDMGYIQENKCIEVGKQDIVGQYLGQSAQKANAAIQSALGGVLFIDEAYSLCEKYQGDGFAKEAVEVILKSMEDYRDNLIIIFAGYTKEMKEFKEMNPGLKSRIGLTIEFPDYNADELTQIFVKKAQENGYNIPLESQNKIHFLCDLASKEKDFGNGRFVENLFREVEINHALTTKDCDAYDTKILTILPEDIDVDILDKIL